MSMYSYEVWCDQYLVKLRTGNDRFASTYWERMFFGGSETSPPNRWGVNLSRVLTQASMRFWCRWMAESSSIPAFSSMALNMVIFVPAHKSNVDANLGTCPSEGGPPPPFRLRLDGGIRKIFGIPRRSGRRRSGPCRPSTCLDAFFLVSFARLYLPGGKSFPFTIPSFLKVSSFFFRCKGIDLLANLKVLGFALPTFFKVILQP